MRGDPRVGPEERRSGLAVSHNTVYVILFWDSLYGGSAGKESTTSNVGDLGSIPLVGKKEEGKSQPLQYSRLEHSMGSSPCSLCKYNYCVYVFRIHLLTK